MQVADLPAIDQRIQATADTLDRYSPDDLIHAVHQAADEIDGARRVQQREQRQQRSSFVSVQPSFDGEVRLYAELDPLAGATVLNALDAASERPDGDPSEPGEPTKRARQRADGLVRICGDWLGGDTNRPARPLLVAHVDLTQITATAAGTLELATPGRLPTLTARVVEQLARQADLQSILFDGHRPLTVTSKLRAEDVPDDTRLAVGARDMG
jgi:Domain of unknown function (DUF222)